MDFVPWRRILIIRSRGGGLECGYATICRNGHLLARWEHIVDRFDLSGAIALITGSSRGIGRTLAAGLADAGARIVLNGKHSAGLEEAAARFREQYGADRVYARAFDITAEPEVAAAVNWIEDEVGPIRILINNAGVQHRVPLLELDETNWDHVLRVNLTGAFLVGREVARHMITRGRGKIINIASVQSELARPTIAAYTTAKGGLRNLTRAMTAEWAAAGLQINALAPGYIHTEMTQRLVDDPAFNDWVLNRTPAGRWGSSADLVGPAVWLASDGSDYVNGQVIYVDGGMTVVL
jgi:gluconate 5-dehydrogenase